MTNKNMMVRQQISSAQKSCAAAEMLISVIAK